MKEFSKFFIASLKRTAQNVYPLVRRKTKLLKMMNEMQEELNSLQVQIDSYQTPIKEVTGGYTTEDLITRKVTVTDKRDKDGNPIKITQYVLTYPDTVIPCDTQETLETQAIEEVVEEPQEAQETSEEENNFSNLPFN